MKKRPNFRESSRLKFNRNCFCLKNRLNSFGLPTGSVVDAILGYPLARGRGAKLGKIGWGRGSGGGGVCLEVLQ